MSDPTDIKRDFDTPGLKQAILCRNQHRFVKDKSCRVHSILKKSGIGFVDYNNATDVTCFDFSKAFFKIPRDILDSELIKCKIDDGALEQIHSWLCLYRGI